MYLTPNKSLIEKPFISYNDKQLYHKLTENKVLSFFHSSLDKRQYYVYDTNGYLKLERSKKYTRRELINRIEETIVDGSIIDFLKSYEYIHSLNLLDLLKKDTTNCYKLVIYLMMTGEFRNGNFKIQNY